MPDDEMNPLSEAANAPADESADGLIDELDEDTGGGENTDSAESTAPIGEEDAGEDADVADDEPTEEDDASGEENADPADESAPDPDGVPNSTGEDDVESESGDPEGDGEDTDESAEDGESALPLASVVEAVLFAAREPLKAAQIASAVGKRTRQDAVREAIAELNVHYLETSRSFEIAEISERYQLMSRPEYAPHIMRIYPKRDLVEKDKVQRLTPAALDTLAIIAYKQPVTRGDIEHIRGVGCGPVLRALIERGSVRVAGKRTDLVGQPLVYGTTEAFLAEFGLGTLDELPLRSEFLGMLGSEDIAVEYNEPEPETAEKDDEDAEQPAPEAEEGPVQEVMAENDDDVGEEGDDAPETDPEEDQPASESAE